MWVHPYFHFVDLAGGGTVVEDGTGEASFTVTRTGLNAEDPDHQQILADPLTVNLEDRGYEIVAPEVPATWGDDFALTKAVTISGGQVSQTEHVTPIDDPEGERVEVIAVAVKPSSSYQIGLYHATAILADEHHCGPDVTAWFIEELNIHAAFWRSVGALLAALRLVCDCFCTFWEQETGWKPVLRACGSAGRRRGNRGRLGGMGGRVS